MHATKAEMRAVPIEQFGEIIERGRAFAASEPPNNLLTSGGGV
jgi:hypothetical protein